MIPGGSGQGRWGRGRGEWPRPPLAPGLRPSPGSQSGCFGPAVTTLPSPTSRPPPSPGRAGSLGLPLTAPVYPTPTRCTPTPTAPAPFPTTFLPSPTSGVGETVGARSSPGKPASSRLPGRELTLACFLRDNSFPSLAVPHCLSQTECQELNLPTLIPLQGPTTWEILSNSTYRKPPTLIRYPTPLPYLN